MTVHCNIYFNIYTLNICISRLYSIYISIESGVRGRVEAREE